MCPAANENAGVTEPQPADSQWPRYSTRRFPEYRFVPGHAPHPRRHPLGHSYRQCEERPAPFPPEEWAQSTDYLYGIDLYNFAYWWESHEVFEGLWHAVGHDTEQGQCFQALIQLAAANLKHYLARRIAAQKLLLNGIVRLRRVPSFFMGIDVTSLIDTILTRIDHSHLEAPLIHLVKESPAGSYESQ